MNKNKTLLHRESGLVLIVSLIMLIVLTLIGISVIRLSTANLQLVNNMQGRNQALAAAQSVVNEVLSQDFINVADIKAKLNAIAAASYSYSPEGEDASKKIYTVTVSKPCLKGTFPATQKIINVIRPEIAAKIKKINELISSSDTPAEDKSRLEADKALLVKQNHQYGTCIGSGATPCYITLWEFSTTVSSGFLGARSSVSAGAEVIVNAVNGIIIRGDTTLYCAS